MTIRYASQSRDPAAAGIGLVCVLCAFVGASGVLGMEMILRIHGLGLDDLHGSGHISPLSANAMRVVPLALRVYPVTQFVSSCSVIVSLLACAWSIFTRRWRLALLITGTLACSALSAYRALYGCFRLAGI